MSQAKPSPERINDVSRRRFLALLAHGGWAAALGVLVYQIGRFLGAEGLQTGPAPLVIAGKLVDFPPETTIYVPEARAWVQREAASLTALDAVCPHLGCLVQQKKAAAGFAVHVMAVNLGLRGN